MHSADGPNHSGGYAVERSALDVSHYPTAFPVHRDVDLPCAQVGGFRVERPSTQARVAGISSPRCVDPARRSWRWTKRAALRRTWTGRKGPPYGS